MKLSSIDARMAISIGTVDLIESSFGVGNAYKISGKALDRKGKRKIKFVSDVLPNSDILDLLIQNTDYISSKWMGNQSKIILLALQNMDQRTIAANLKITQQAVSKQMDSIGWMIVEDNLNLFKNVLLSVSNNAKPK